MISPSWNSMPLARANPKATFYSLADFAAADFAGKDSLTRGQTFMKTVTAIARLSQKLIPDRNSQGMIRNSGWDGRTNQKAPSDSSAKVWLR